MTPSTVFFQPLPPKEFGQCFSKWAKTLGQLSDKKIVAVDGKRI
jgi:hypothetical protein